MTRTIKAADVKVGMEIEFDHKGLFSRLVVGDITIGDCTGAFWFYPSPGRLVLTPGIPPDTEVTVLSEAQPEEPTWAGAKVLAGVRRFLRGGKGIKPWRGVYSDGVVGDFPLSWSDVCSRGPVTVIPDNGWTVPDNAQTEGELTCDRSRLVRPSPTWTGCTWSTVVRITGAYSRSTPRRG